MNRAVARQSYVRSTYYVYSELMAQVSALESKLELDYVNWLNHEKRATKFKAQPYSVYYMIKGRKRRYTPDFLVEIDGVTYLIEIKYKKDTLSEEFKHKVRVLTRFFAAQDLVFKVQTEEDIHVGERAKNLSFLQPVLNHGPPIAEMEYVAQQLPFRNASLIDFHKALDSIGHDLSLSRRGIAHGLIKCDLKKLWQDLQLSW